MKSQMIVVAFACLLAAGPASAQEKKGDLHIDALMGVGMGEDYVDNNVKAGASIGYDLRLNGMVLGAEAEVFDGLSLGVKAGAALPGGALIYAKGGYAAARANILAPGGAFIDRRWVNGARVGAGVQLPISKRFSIKGEYRYTNYDLGLESHQLAGGIGFHF